MNDDLSKDLNPQPGDLQWLAFRFIAGELPGDEARAFELQLAEDQTAREAVSRAVALGMRLADATPAVRGGVAPRHRTELRSNSATAPSTALHLRRVVHAMAWASMGAAASMAMWFWSQRTQIVESGPPGSGSPTAPRRENKVDAIAWMQLRAVGESTGQVQRQFDEWKPDDVPNTEPPREPVVPAWVVELATASDGKEKK